MADGPSYSKMRDKAIWLHQKILDDLRKKPAQPDPRIEFHFSNGHVNFYRFDSDTDVQRWMVVLDKKIEEHEAALREERS